MRAGQEYPVVSDLVLAGGGHAHALLLRMWAMKPLPGVRVTVINPGPAAPYTGMLPGLIAGHYQRDEILIDLVRLARFAGARLILDRVVGIDRAARQVLLAGRPPLSYDVMSLDIGIVSDLPEVPGFAAHAAAAKPLGSYAEAWERFVARAPERPQLVVLGGGVGGVELALAQAARLRAGGRQTTVSIVDRSQPLARIGAGARAALMACAAEAGVRFVTGAEAVAIGADSVTLSNGAVLASDFTLSVAGARAQGWLAETGLALEQGFVAVGPTLQSSDPAIFAVGDCAHLTHAPRPKAGVFAVREAPMLFHNLRAALAGGAMRQYQPQGEYLKLISTGGRAAVADKFGLRAEGAWLWRLKDRIDRKFMAKFEQYPAMALPRLPAQAVPGLAEAIGDKPLCGGCGAKLGPEGLAGALAGLPAPRRADVLSGRGDDAAVLRTSDGVQVLTTDHLRSFTQDARLMARFAANHALGDVFAMGAAPQVALAQVILPRLSAAKGAEMLAEIMAEAALVFGAEGADVVGGHSSVGAELTIGFTVTGLGARAVAKGGAQAGDVLILTKPLGTGVILAAEMAQARVPGLVLGESVGAAYASMARSLGPAARILAGAAHAMTDVTGFGLAGHLLEMLEASGLAATVPLGSVPLLPGAEALAAEGQGSSLWPANRAAVLARISGALDDPRAALLYDPQTCGGLLAAVPQAEAAALLDALQTAGETAAIIGTLSVGAPGLRLV